MPNIRGGKGYKKFKKEKEDDEVEFLTREKDQYVGCIIRLLGNLNASVFCEDNKTRLCKIAEGIKKKIRFYVGDIVLVSYRDDLLSKEAVKQGEHSDRGDILAKYHREQYSQLKGQGINAHIFRHIDTLSSMASSFAKGDSKKAEEIAAAATNDDLFESADEEEEDEKEVKPKLEWKAVRASGVKNMAEEANHLSQPQSQPKKKEEDDDITLDDL